MKNHTAYDIFEFPTNLGLRANGLIEPGVRQLPGRLKECGLYAHFEPCRVLTLAAPGYGRELDEDSGVLNCAQVASYALAQADMLLQHWSADRKKIIIGGDCSILIGTALALRQKGRYGLFFLDGHTDFVSPEFSQSRAVAGMDLAIVTGYGHEKLSNLRGAQPFFVEEDVYCVGNRSKASAYLDPLLASRIHYHGLDELRRKGISSLVSSFLEMVAKHALDGFLIHIDVDVLDDTIMPAVDSRQEGGMCYAEFNPLLKKLVAHKKCVGVQIAILDPTLDIDSRYTKEFVQNFIQAF